LLLATGYPAPLWALRFPEPRIGLVDWFIQGVILTTLAEFLLTADADSATALVQARAFSEQVLKSPYERITEVTGE